MARYYDPNKGYWIDTGRVPGEVVQSNSPILGVIPRRYVSGTKEYDESKRNKRLNEYARRAEVANTHVPSVFSSLINGEELPQPQQTQMLATATQQTPSVPGRNEMQNYPRPMRSSTTRPKLAIAQAATEPEKVSQLDIALAAMRSGRERTLADNPMPGMPTTQGYRDIPEAPGYQRQTGIPRILSLASGALSRINNPVAQIAGGLGESFAQENSIENAIRQQEYANQVRQVGLENTRIGNENTDARQGYDDLVARRNLMVNEGLGTARLPIEELLAKQRYGLTESQIAENEAQRQRALRPQVFAPRSTTGTTPEERAKVQHYLNLRADLQASQGFLRAAIQAQDEKLIAFYQADIDRIRSQMGTIEATIPNTGGNPGLEDGEEDL